MAQRDEIVSVYAAGMIQGIALVTFPAASAIFSSPVYYSLSSTEYGGMFVPQAIMAIASSLMGGGLTRRMGIKRIYLLGLVADLLAMTFLVLSQFVMHKHSLAYGILLTATTCMGFGFGLTVPAINTFAAAFFPHNVDKAVLVLNALLGVGTALAPAFVAIFVGLGIWWGLPVLVGALTLALLSFSRRLPLGETARSSAAEAKIGGTKLPARFWIFATFALLYGICETMNGNWASLYMTKQLGANTTLASLALTTFWGTVTAGRILFAVIEKWFPERRTCQVLPFVVTSAFIAISFLPTSRPYLAILGFALAGLGCSALLPLTVSFAEEELTTISASVAGGLIAFYQMGYGIAAFGVGPLQSLAGLELNTIYGGTAIFALLMSALSFVVVRPLSIDMTMSRIPRSPNT
jgi:MFS family permease